MRVHWTPDDELTAACGMNLADGRVRSWSRDPLKVTCDRCAKLQALKLARIEARKLASHQPLRCVMNGHGMMRKWWD